MTAIGEIGDEIKSQNSFFLIPRWYLVSMLLTIAIGQIMKRILIHMKREHRLLFNHNDNLQMQRLALDFW